MSIRTALAESVNVPAVKMLYLVGLKDSISTISSFGVGTLTNPNAYGLSLVLGGGAVHLIDLTEAYSVLAADGTKHAQSMILQVQDANNKVLESYADQTTQVADPQNVRLVNDILSDANARSGLFQNSLSLTVFPGYDVALKTGTSNDYRDAWSMGYTPDLVAGVWAGNNNNTPMQKNGSSILAAVPIWHAFMAQALAQSPQDAFPPPPRPRRPPQSRSLQETTRRTIRSIPFCTMSIKAIRPAPHQSIPPRTHSSIAGRPASSIGRVKTFRTSRRNIISRSLIIGAVRFRIIKTVSPTEIRSLHSSIPTLPPTAG